MAEKVQRMFARIAPRYDRANTVLSLGTHHKWRRRLVKMALPPKGGDILDVATGTGDLAIEFRKSLGRGGHVVGVDFCEPMLERAREKADAKGLKIDFREGDALDLPFEDASFDVASIAFGIRNVDDPGECLKEMARVVRPGGRVAVLEFGQPQGMMRWPYAIYRRLVMPVVGGLMTGDRHAYQYLPRTAMRFPSGARFVELLDSTGRFVHTRAASMTGGICYAYVSTVGDGGSTPSRSSH